MKKVKVMDEYGRLISHHGLTLTFNNVSEAVDWLLNAGYKPGHISQFTITDVTK